MSHPCTLGTEGQPCGHCRRCWLYANRPDYRAHWDGQPAPPATPPRGECRFLGEPTGAFVECESCKRPDGSPGKTRLKVYACSCPARAADPTCLLSYCASDCPHHQRKS